MMNRLPTLIATLSIAGLLVLMASISRDERAAASVAPETPTAVSPQERSGGSEVPCAVPLAWRITRVDPEFGITEEDATTIVREAAQLWENGTGRSLFAHDPAEGFPIRLVFDERQELVNERGTRARDIGRLGAQLTEEQTDLRARNEIHTAAVTDHAERVNDLQRRAADHSATIRRLNEQGGVPAARAAQIAATTEALTDEQRVLETEGRALDADLMSLREEQDRLNERILAHQRLGEELVAAFPPSAVEAGEYREAVTWRDGEVETVSREIRLYRFASDADLRLVAAHELGHALGLGHTPDPDGVMSASARSDQPIEELAGTDVQLLRAVCPTG